MKGKPARGREKNWNATWFGKWWWLCCTQMGSWEQREMLRLPDVNCKEKDWLAS